MENNIFRSIASSASRGATRFTDDTGSTVLSSAAAAAKVVMFGGILPLGYRGLCWLQDGNWPELTLYSLGLAPPWLSWAGARELLNLVFSLPVEPVAIAGCAAIYGVASAILDNRRPARREPSRYP